MEINKLPKTIRNKVKLVINSVDKHFQFLKNEGYILKRRGIAKQYVVDNIIQIIYENAEIDRRIIIQYEPFDIDDKIVDLISVSLYKDIYNQESELVLEKYLEKYNSNIDVEQLNYPMGYSEKKFDKWINNSIAGYSYFLKDNGQNLVNGTEWEDGLKFDWSEAEDILYNAQKDILYNEDLNNTGKGGFSNND